MILRYIYSACIVLETSDLKICCDPWFTQGIYDGSWYQYPEVSDPIDKIGRVDLIYISHIHPDHYDPPFLRALVDANPGCRIVIGNENQRFLEAKMRRDGFEPHMISELTVGSTDLAIIPNYSDAEINVDSALVVKDATSVLVNMNDCPFDSQQVDSILEFAGRRPDLACLPYAGAGPFPQAYRFDNEKDQLAAAERKKDQFLELFGRYLTTLNPTYAMPFAGLYYLGGSRRWMNSLRGVPDALEVAQRFGDQIVVLQEGVGTIDLPTGEVTHARTRMYDSKERDVSLSKFDSVHYPYEVAPRVPEAELVEKLKAAHRNACSRLLDKPSMWMCFKAPETRFMCVHSDDPGQVVLTESVESLEPREEMFLDGRLLAGLFERRYHWNNAEIGSHFEFRRFPEKYDRRVYNLLNFLHA